jgi:hypothetical protein
MYYRVNGKPVIEEYAETFEKDKKSKNVFPLWLLILIIAVLICTCLLFLWYERHQANSQEFGFAFY